MGSEMCIRDRYKNNPAYGAKVEGAVATAFNELYKGKDLEEAVADFAKVREAYKKEHNGKSFQNINEFLEQKKKMAASEEEKKEIEELEKQLDLK